MFVLDTNFLIDLHSEMRRIEGPDGPASRFMLANRSKAMAITPITASEYAAGIRSEREARRWLRRFKLVPLGKELAMSASRLDRQQSSKGLRLGENDNWQAATALHYGFTLVSDDKGFGSVDELKHCDYTAQ